MGKITNLEQLAQTASAAKTFTSGLVAELAEAANQDIAAAKSAAQAAQRTADAAKAAAQKAQDTLDGKQDAGNAVPFTIPAAGWAAGEIDESSGGDGDVQEYSYCYDLAVDGITAKDRADVTLSPGSIGTAAACGLCPATETLAGKIRLRAARRPDGNIAAEYWLCSGKE